MPLLTGLSLALVVGGLWVGLTVWTGKTYHLAPLIVAAIPGFGARWSTQRPLDRVGRLLAFGLGLGAVAAAWVAILALDAAPHATIVEGLPGGVLFEVVVGGLIGAVVGAVGLSLFRRG